MHHVHRDPLPGVLVLTSTIIDANSIEAGVTTFHLENLVYMYLRCAIDFYLKRLLNIT